MKPGRREFIAFAWRLGVTVIVAAVLVVAAFWR